MFTKWVVTTCLFTEAIQTLVITSSRFIPTLHQPLQPATMHIGASRSAAMQCCGLQYITLQVWLGCLDMGFLKVPKMGNLKGTKVGKFERYQKCHPKDHTKVLCYQSHPNTLSFKRCFILWIIFFLTLTNILSLRQKYQTWDLMAYSQLYIV